MTLTHWGPVTHIFVGNLTIIGSDNGLSPGRCQIALVYIMPSLHQILVIIIQSGTFVVIEAYINCKKVHKQALRVVLNDYTSSYSDLLTKMARPTLYVTRLKAIATEAYKSYANENPAYINAMLNPSITPYNLRGGSRAEQPKVNTTSCGLNTFSYQAAKLWNNLPSFIKEATSVTEFKSLVSKWPGPKCQCGYCVLCRIYTI